MGMRPLLETDKVPKSVRNIRMRGVAKTDMVKCERIMEQWNRLAKECNLPQIRELSEHRTAKVLARLKYYRHPSQWKDLFRKIKASPVLHTRPVCSWFTFDWVVRNDENLDKIMNGWMDWKQKGSEPAPAVTKGAVDRRLISPLMGVPNGAWTEEELSCVVAEMEVWYKKQTSLFMSKPEFVVSLANYLRKKHAWKDKIRANSLSPVGNGEVWKDFVEDMKKRGVTINGC